MKYRKKPEVIEAFQMTQQRRTDRSEWPGWLNQAWLRDRSSACSLFPEKEGTEYGHLCIGTREWLIRIDWNDWLIKGLKGQIYACKPDIFDATYEKVE